MRKLRTALLGRFEELELLATREEREEVLDLAWGQQPWFRFVALYFGLWIVGALAYSRAFDYAKLCIDRTWQIRPGKLTELACFVSLSVPVTIMCFYIAHRTCRKGIKQSLRKQLVGRSIAVCVGCGYDLRGLDSGRCPECGVEWQCPTPVESGGGE